jgi:hypothetical protein
MRTSAESVPVLTRTAWIRCVLVVGLLVGIADYGVGFGVFVAGLGRPVLTVFQHPAAGLLGPDAYRGGIRTACLGTALHFCFAIGWAAIFVWAYRTSAKLSSAVATTGGLLLISVLAGVFVWLFMNYIVIGASRIRPYSARGTLFWTVLLAHIPFVGLPLVWGTRRFVRSASGRDFVVSTDESVLSGRGHR